MLISSILSSLYNANTAESSVDGGVLHYLAKRGVDKHSTFYIVSIVLIPTLVILSGIFAGLTLGYMSLDETQLSVLATSGTPKQQEYAKKIIPVRKNGHLLLVSLLLANMVVNETLPVISDEVLGGGFAAVAVSTVLIVIFSEIIPQSLCTRYGLYIGAKCAIPTQILMYALWIIAWPIAKLLEWILGPHHGIIYRRGELKELINMHSTISPHGGDLKHDTVTIIGHTLDLQEKVVRDAMTPIDKVFMLPIDAKLDYETLRKVCESGHSRVPVYEEFEFKVGAPKLAKKIVGILLVKQCVLLDPKDATPLHSIPLNKVPSVPFDEPLLTMLDRFQEGRSHMAVVSLFSRGKAASVRDAVKTGLTRRFLNRVGLGDSDDESEKDVEKAIDGPKEEKDTIRRFIPGLESREQAMPADAVLAKTDADDFLKGIDTLVNPLGIITLEDVLEELIGEEILDEFDLTGPQAASSYVPPSARRAEEERSHRASAPAVPIVVPPGKTSMQFPAMPKVASTLNIFNRSKSQPGTPRMEVTRLPEEIKEKEKTKDVADGDTLKMEKNNNDSDATTLKATLTSETGTTFAPGMDSSPTDGSDPRTIPALLLPAPESRSRSVSIAAPSVAGTGTTARTSSPAPLAEAILQTQTRRRAQATMTSGPSETVAPPPAQGGKVVVPRGRFKSSPLSPVADEGVKEKGEGEKENLKDKVPESDPQLKDPKDGL